MRIPFVDLKPALAATRRDWERNLRKLSQRASYILGPMGAAFEEEFAAAMGGRFAVAVGSGSAAIELSLRALDIGPGNEVQTSGLTAPFTAVAIQSSGAKATFADIDPETLLIDPQDAANRITAKTAAMVPVHLYGQPLALERFAGIARSARIALIQDACQAHGARCADRSFAEYSPFVAYSFYPTKNLGCLGDGGAIATNRPGVAKKLREMRDGGRRGGQVSYGPGINSRLDEMQACYLRAFLHKLGEWNDRRRELARHYDRALAEIDGIRPIRRVEGSVAHLYVVRATKRDRLREFLTANGIGTAIHYPRPLHLHPAFAGKLKRGDLPHAERACREIVSLPLHPYLPIRAVETIANTIRRFYAS